jgi:thioredoxin-dependent peroxiredoxin
MNIKIIYSFIIIFFITSLCSAQTFAELKEGNEAPDFTLEDAFGNDYTLSFYEGKNPVVIYFYPKAGTAGCTKQACGIRDELQKFKEKDIKVFGISTDPIEKIEKFVEEYRLNFPLLSDEDKSVSESYGVLRESGLANRMTFIINKEGLIERIIEVKDVDTHAEEVYEIAKDLI